MPPARLSASADLLVRWLSEAAQPTKREAAERLGCSEKTVRRAVAEAKAAGVPIREVRRGREKAYALAPEHQRRTLTLDTLDEAALHALAVAAQASGAVLAGTPLAEPLARAFGALLDALHGVDGGHGPDSFEPDDEAALWSFGPLAPSPTDPGVFAALALAVRQRRSVRVDYTNASGERRPSRKLDPLAVGVAQGTWLLAAWCHTRREVRDFSLARVSHVHPLSDGFAPPSGFDRRAHFAGRFGAIEGDAPVEVRLAVSADRATYFRTKRYHPSQTVEDRVGGGATVTFWVPGGDGLDAVRAFVASWGPYVVAEAPPALAARLADDARQTAAAYG